MTTIATQPDITSIPASTPSVQETSPVSESSVTTVVQTLLPSSEKSTPVPSASSTTSPLSSPSVVPSASTTSLKELPISKLFATQKPIDVLRTISGKECHCIPQFSRLKDADTDARQITEDALCDMIAAKFSKSETLTICSIASGNCTEELFLLAQLRSKGFDKVKFILVDPWYLSTKTPLNTFKKLAKEICPKVEVETLASLEDVVSSEVQADVFFDFDDGQLDESTEEYMKMMEPFEKYVHSFDKPVVYVHSEKRYAGSSMEKNQKMINVKAVVTLNYISPTESECESRTIFDKTMPMKENSHHHIKLLGEEDAS